MPYLLQLQYHLPHIGLLLRLVPSWTISCTSRAARSSAMSFFLLFVLCVWCIICGGKLAGPSESATDSACLFSKCHTDLVWPMVRPASWVVRACVRGTPLRYMRHHLCSRALPLIIADERWSLLVNAGPHSRTLLCSHLLSPHSPLVGLFFFPFISISYLFISFSFHLSPFVYWCLIRGTLYIRPHPAVGSPSFSLWIPC